VNDSKWWAECVGPDAGKGIHNRRAKAATKTYTAIVKFALRDNPADADLNQRRLAACELMTWATDIWIDKAHAGRKRSIAHDAQRLAAGGAAVVAAGSGAALAVGLTGTAATVWGLVVLGLAAASAAAAAMWPAADYDRNRSKARLYEQLWRDMWVYLTQKLPADSPDKIANQREEFSKRVRSIA
jgi:hypothetical protein